MSLRSWLRTGLVAGGLFLGVGEALAQRGGGDRGGGGPGGPAGPGGPGGMPGGGMFPGGGPGGPGGGFGGMGGGRGGFGGSPEEKWARFAGNSDSFDLNDPKNAMMRGMLAQRYQIPPDGILRRSSYIEQATKMSGGMGMGGPPGMGMGGPGGPSPFPGAPAPSTGGEQKVVIIGSGVELQPPPGGPGGDRGGRGFGGFGGPGGDRGGRGGDQQPPDRGGDRGGDRGNGDPVEDPRPLVVRYGNLPKDAPSYWNDLDKDHDGQISLYEWRTGSRNVEEFVGLDLNTDGYLTVEEHQRALKQAAEEQNGGKKVDPRSNGRGGPGGGMFGGGSGPGGGMFGGRGGPGGGGPGGPGGFQFGRSPGGDQSGKPTEQPRDKGDKGDKTDKSERKKGRN